MNNIADDSPLRRLLTISAVAGAAMSAVVLLLWFSGNLISMWVLTTDLILWICIVWGMTELKKRSEGHMNFGKAFTYGLQMSFFSALFVSFVYLFLITMVYPSFLEDYYQWTETFMRSVIPADLPAEQLKELNAKIDSELKLTRETTTPISFALGKLINYSLFGGLFSLVAAAILRNRHVPPRKVYEKEEAEN